jgi:predicted RNase H-like HicB family nuclease
MKHYYALFKKTDEAVEVKFPDLQGCCTLGNDWEEALENAYDVLAAWLINAEPEFIPISSDLRCCNIQCTSTFKLLYFEKNLK